MRTLLRTLSHRNRQHHGGRRKTHRFNDRIDAAYVLASQLEWLRGQPRLLILGLPRGGAVVAAHIATLLQAPFDVFLVRKLSLPNDPEVAFGAIASGGVRVLIPGMLRQLHLTPDVVEAITRQQQCLLNEREQRYRGEQAPPTLTGKVVLLVDDGVATGATMRAAILAARQEGAETVITAVPVGPADVIQQLRTIADSVVCPIEAGEYTSVSQWYSDFRPVADDEVVALLRHHESGTVL